MDIKITKEETTEKLLAMEVEHLKMSNMMEVQKIEEIKQDIEKSKNMKYYIQTEITELKEKLKNMEVESKQKELEYSIQKNELEEKLKLIKVEVKNEQNNKLNHEDEFKRVIIRYNKTLD